jgi:hypothetical protein
VTDEEIRELVREYVEAHARATEPYALRDLSRDVWGVLTWPWRSLRDTWRYANGLERGMMVAFGAFVSFLAFVLLGMR